jgi:VIT1/CCC1 family predicted Fe2+/Mn2+ transporter
MKESIKKGLGFGLASGVITTLGLIVGLSSGTHLKTVVLSGILVIAIADALSDALGIHISEESEKGVKTKEVWESTFSTFFFKFIVALTFMVPVLLFSLESAVFISLIWGAVLLGGISFYVAKSRKENPFGVVMEHLVIAALVVIATHFVGVWASGLA